MVTELPCALSSLASHPYFGPVSSSCTPAGFVDAPRYRCSLVVHGGSRDPAWIQRWHLTAQSPEIHCPTAPLHSFIRSWPTLAKPTLAKFSKPKKPKPQDLHSDLNPKTQTGREGARPFGPTLRPAPSPPLQGHTWVWPPPSIEMCTFGLSKRAHFRPPALQTQPKFHEKTPRERETKNETGGGRWKKSAKVWAPHPSGPHPSGPHPSGPHFSGFWEPHPSDELLYFFSILLVVV